MHLEILQYNQEQSENDRSICDLLSLLIDTQLTTSNSKIWHRHPVWFIDENPIVGYSKEKKGIRLIFWSGDSFGETLLSRGTGKFKDASIYYNHVDQIVKDDVHRWLQKSQSIQWDYKNIVKRKGVLERLK
jgi:hypothetical protein